MPTRDNLITDSLELIHQQMNESINIVSSSGTDYWEMIIRLAFNLITAFILIRLIYYPGQKNKDFLFTFFLFNFLIFLICILLSSANIKAGLAFGLFALFSILRYRTETIPIKEMGYLFACVSLGVINALANKGDSFSILIICNALIVLMAWMLDSIISFKHENFKDVIYERIDLVHSDKMEDLKTDLIQRTGLPIHRVEIKSINYLRDTANLQIFYYTDRNENPIIGNKKDDSYPR
jgi:hypothetical protein